MPCESQFPADVQFTCIIKLIGQTRSDMSIQILKEWLWLAGCMVEKFAPITLPPTSEVQTFKTDLNSKLDELEVLCESKLDSTATPLLASFDWSIIVPIVLQIAEMLLRKYLPTPTPVSPPEKK